MPHLKLKPKCNNVSNIPVSFSGCNIFGVLLVDQESVVAGPKRENDNRPIRHQQVHMTHLRHLVLNLSICWLNLWIQKVAICRAHLSPKEKHEKRFNIKNNIKDFHQLNNNTRRLNENFCVRRRLSWEMFASVAEGNVGGDKLEGPIPSSQCISEERVNQATQEK